MNFFFLETQMTNFDSAYGGYHDEPFNCAPAPGSVNKPY